MIAYSRLALFRSPILSVAATRRQLLSSSLIRTPYAPVRFFASTPGSSTANNKGNYAANEIPISTTSNPEPNRGPGPSSVRVADKLKDAYSGLKERVLQTKQAVQDNVSNGSGVNILEKGKEMLSKGKQAMASGREKMSHAGDGFKAKFEKFEQNIEEKGLGPVTGDHVSLQPGGFNASPAASAAQGDVYSTQDAAIGGQGIIAKDLNEEGHLPGPVVMEDDEETGHVRMRPVDSAGPTTSQSASASSSEPTSGSTESATLEGVDSAKSGVQGTAAEHAAQEQRQKGLTSDELLGTNAIKGKDSVKAARPPTPTRGSGASRAAQ